MTKLISIRGSIALAAALVAAGTIMPATSFAQASSSQSNSSSSPDPTAQRANQRTLAPNQRHGGFLFDDDSEASRKFLAASATGKCVARRAGDKAGDYFGGQGTSDPQYAKLSELLSRKYQNCFDGSRSEVSMYSVNAALAEALLLKADAAPAGAVSDPAKAQSFYLVDGAIRSLDGLDRCIAVNSPGLVRAMLETRPGSPEEKSALAEAYAKTPQCGVATPPDAASSVEHREMLATGLYQWTTTK